ncbi:MAG TPA: LutB/LldF family L-lactate oxidation iron-sulfur protein, partial [Hyphomicrobiaceae bacterium]|nr:LutB/LldF family L-lactate oxidation iron-sulfur protein [Hyphomicrobiaceae bacterium]
MLVNTERFKGNASAALKDAQLQRALAGLPTGLVARRTQARAGLPEFEALRDVAKGIKEHTLENLDLYLEAWEKKATAAGAKVHWAANAAEAREIILGICRSVDAKVVTKGKSMISEEIGLNAHLEATGIEVVETDLGEYLVQIRKETPSHIIAPAIHLTQDQVEADFRRLHTHLPKDRVLVEPHQLVGEAREVLRQKYLQAQVGITGANFLVAETGSSVIVTNEGNGDLTQSLAKVHVAIASIEKIVPTLEDVSTIVRLLARSATGQEISTYTTFSTGPRRPGDPDGPEQYHVVVLDNGRTEMLASPMREALRCIRCGACMNHCPVYGAIGGHAYGWVYPGPIGSVLTPALIGVKTAGNLPNASTFCGRCESVCPMKIPLPKLMRDWREAEFAQGLTSGTARTGLKLWSFL